MELIILSYLDQIIFSVIVSVMGADGVDEYKVSFVDGSVYSWCASSTACSRIYEDRIFIDINKLYKRDNCNRNPLQHELSHFVYLDKLDIHKVCTPSVSIIDWRYAE
jgi:hypothetical protein